MIEFKIWPIREEDVKNSASAMHWTLRAVDQEVSAIIFVVEWGPRRQLHSTGAIQNSAPAVHHICDRHSGSFHCTEYPQSLYPLLLNKLQNPHCCSGATVKSENWFVSTGPGLFYGQCAYATSNSGDTVPLGSEIERKIQRRFYTFLYLCPHRATYCNM